MLKASRIRSLSTRKMLVMSYCTSSPSMGVARWFNWGGGGVLTFKLRYITLEGSWRIRTQHKQPYYVPAADHFAIIIERRYNHAILPRTRTSLGDRSFTVAGPRCNNLPVHLCDSEILSGSSAYRWRRTCLLRAAAPRVAYKSILPHKVQNIQI